MLASEEIYLCIYAMGIPIPAISFRKAKRTMLVLSSFAIRNCHTRYYERLTEKPMQKRILEIRNSSTANNHPTDVVTIAEVL